MAGQPRASVIIPAHNEAAVIGRTLEELLRGADAGELDVVVVCNGCTDATEQAARAFPSADVRVLSIPEASKSCALNAGDSEAKAHPRLYLDGDVELSTEGARRMVEALATSDCAVAVPAYRLEGCRPLARAYWREWQRRNSAPRAGTGCYGLSEAARLSFGEFPELIGDDLWVATQFTPQSVPGTVTQVRVARTVPAILRRRIRVARGNRQLLAARPLATAHRGHEPAEVHPAGAGGPAARETGAQGRRSPIGVGVLIGTHAVASLWSRAFRSGGWGQDQTTRR